MEEEEEESMATQMKLRVKVALEGASRTWGVVVVVVVGGLMVLRVVGMDATLWSGARIIMGMIVCVTTNNTTTHHTHTHTHTHDDSFFFSGMLRTRV
jgi:hypothetical protein